MSRTTTALLLLATALGASWAWWRYAPASLPVFARTALPTSPAARPDNPPLYKWRDAKGRWQITDVPPSDRPYETVVVDPNTNVMPSLLPKEEGESGER
ncbi:MAG TPA: DUF4124 domain-containing protein [Xanthomonadales bacterium]|nr:DUF4124 domain-containing protein [Xanthomonadales bacterium]